MYINHRRVRLSRGEASEGGGHIMFAISYYLCDEAKPDLQSVVKKKKKISSPAPHQDLIRPAPLVLFA